ncbi:methyltransferase domain-containing protein [Aeromonas veronii]
MKDSVNVDYHSMYDSYWCHEDRENERSSNLVDISELIASSCGFGKVLDVGSGEGYLVCELLKRGIDAYGFDVSDIVIERANTRWPERFYQGSILSMPFSDDSFDYIVSTDCMEHLAKDDVPKALQELYRVSSRYVFLQIATTEDRDGHWHLTVENRTWWESCCFENGFRKHPLYYHVNNYESLNNDGWQIFILLEKVNKNALDKYDLKVLPEERLLHTDMLRETGRRSDAHCIRYHKAAELIRPEDTVLDVACGLGYGSHILYQNSRAKKVVGVDLSDFGISYARAHYGMTGEVEFYVGDAQRLDEIPDNSIDFITAFETIEHVPEPELYLNALKRVLKPSGRIMLCAPNNWADETGKDPNPHHLHVYTWPRLVGECSKYFMLEKGYTQVAGGAMKCHHSPRKWTEIDPNKELDSEAEWILLLVMKNPAEGINVPYYETCWKIPESDEFNVSAFSRDYNNPWLVKGMIAIGMRNTSYKCLSSMQQNVLNHFSMSSVDYGAALCGYIYNVMSYDCISEQDYNDLVSKVIDYKRIDEPSPHQQRWIVSLLYAGGELARKRGDISKAKQLYTSCSEYDVLKYSPLLGAKIIDSLYWLAIIYLNEKSPNKAKSYLLKSIQEVRRISTASWLNVIGDIDSPLPFGFPEMAQLFDKASRCVYLLTAINNASTTKQGLIYQESKGFFERQLYDLKRHIENKDIENAQLKETNNNLDKNIELLKISIFSQNSRVEELGMEIKRLNERSQSLAKEIIDMDAHAQALAREVAEKDAHAQALAREVAEKDAHAQALAREVAEKDAHAQALAREVAEKDAQAQSLAHRLVEKEHDI